MLILPLGISFFWLFKNNFFLNYFKHSVGSNCLEELNNSLFQEKTTCDNNLRIGTVDYTELDLTPKNSFTYLSGYFITKCIEKHNCKNNCCYELEINNRIVFIYIL